MPLARWVPGLDSLLHYRRAWFRPDVQAGLSVAAIQIPTAIAYAQIAGFPPQVGLYACILPMLIYALIGSSRQLMVGPDAATRRWSPPPSPRWRRAIRSAWWTCR